MRSQKSLFLIEFVVAVGVMVFHTNKKTEQAITKPQGSTTLEKREREREREHSSFRAFLEKCSRRLVSPEPLTINR